jgi:hypothetical protein
VVSEPEAVFRAETNVKTQRNETRLWSRDLNHSLPGPRRLGRCCLGQTICARSPRHLTACSLSLGPKTEPNFRSTIEGIDEIDNSSQTCHPLHLKFGRPPSSKLGSFLVQQCKLHLTIRATKRVRVTSHPQPGPTRSKTRVKTVGVPHPEDSMPLESTLRFSMLVSLTQRNKLAYEP